MTDKQKDYQLWHKQKQRIHNDQPRVLFHEREIWFAHVGENVGFEQDGVGPQFLRPVAIVKKYNNDFLTYVPLTKTKKESEYYMPFSFKPGIVSTAILSQLRATDAKRLKYKIGYMKQDDFTLLKAKIRHLFA